MQGKGASYNNFNDADAALELSPNSARPIRPASSSLRQPVRTTAASLTGGLGDAALKCDDVGLRRHHRGQPLPVRRRDGRGDQQHLHRVVCAPDADADARAVFAKKKNLQPCSPATCPIRRAAGW